MRAVEQLRLGIKWQKAMGKMRGVLEGWLDGLDGLHVSSRNLGDGWRHIGDGIFHLQTAQANAAAI